MNATRNTTRRAALGCELLESRTNPTGGNVSAFISNGQLFVIGDAGDNAVSTQQDAFGNVVIYGVGGTTVNGQASVNLGPFVPQDAIFVGGDGNDQLDVAGLVVRGGLTAQGGTGNDLVMYRNVTATWVSAYTEGGNDTLITTNVVARVGADFGGGDGYDIWDYNGVMVGNYLTYNGFESIV